MNRRLQASFLFFAICIFRRTYFVESTAFFIYNIDKSVHLFSLYTPDVERGLYED